jgi:hypothetical protein
MPSAIAAKRQDAHQFGASPNANESKQCGVLWPQQSKDIAQIAYPSVYQ